MSQVWAKEPHQLNAPDLQGQRQYLIQEGRWIVRTRSSMDVCNDVQVTNGRIRL